MGAERGPLVRELGLVAAAYAAFAVVFTWPTAAHLDELGLLAAHAPFDALIFRWNLHWVAESLRAGASPFWTEQLFFPERVPLMLHTNTLFYGLVSLPIQVLFTGERGLHIAFHLCVLGSFTAAGLATWALGRRLGLSITGAFVAGVAFAFCGLRVASLPRLHVLCSEFVPMAMLALYWTVEERRLRGPIALALCMTALAYNSASLLTITTVGLVALLPALWKRREPGWVGRLVGAAVAAALLVSPLVPGVVEGLRWGGSLELDPERVVGSLDLAALVWPNANDLLLGLLLPTRPISIMEFYYSFFIGIPLGILVLAAVWSRAPITRSAGWLAVGVTGLVLALGPEVKWLEEPRGIPLPYGFLESWLLPLRVTRVPARFVVLVFLVLALMGGAGLDAFGERLRLGPRAAVVLGALLSIVLALDGTDRFPLRTMTDLEPDPRPLARALEPLPAGSAVLDLPYDGYYTRTLAMYYQTVHRRPILSAAYPRAPRDNWRHFADSALFRLLSSPEPDARRVAKQLAALDLEAERRELRALGIGAIVLHHDIWKFGDAEMRAIVTMRGQAVEEHLAAAWGRPLRVSAGFYDILVFRL